MLIRLLPEQVEKAWESIAPMIESSLPPNVVASYAAMIDVLEAVLMDRAIVWIYYVGEEGKEKPGALVLTTDYRDPIVHTRHMLVYAIYGIRDLSMEVWIDAIQTLRIYAESINAMSIIAYTANPAIVRMIERVGGSAEYTLIEL